MTWGYKIAHKYTHNSDHKIHKMTAVIIKGGAILSVGWNLGWDHAETRALRPNRDYRGAKIYVVRENGGISKPCPDCMKKIKKAGISEIHYIDRDRNPASEKVV